MYSIPNTKVALSISIPLAILLTGSSLVFGWFLGVSSSNLETIAVLTSYVCTILCVTQNRSNYYFGIVTTFLYCLLFYKSGLYAVAAFNGVLVLSLLYGWWRWGADGKPLPVTDISFESIKWYGLFGIGIAALMVGIFDLLDTAYFTVDVIVASLSAVAQLLLDNKKRQTWIVWAIVNVFSIYLFYTQELYMVMVQYIFFLANTAVGYHMWSNSVERREFNEEEVVQA